VLYSNPEQWILFPADILTILPIKFGSQPSTFMSVSESHGNGGIGLVASRRSSTGIFGPDRFNGGMA
jgi:hypothetical protein